MNRLRGKKKNRDEVFAPRPSMDSEPSGPFRMFGKKKSQEEEPKKELDLTAALPSTDDFRTSLLMTGLSARFSMLREQDDPKSKLGKASDDSVLFTKRQSRLMEFGSGAGGLHDIAEIESVKTRQFARVESFVSSDDAASTTGSVMNRAKPIEGNVLFGGRQKIYKIPVGGSSRGGGMGGRALYDDDVAQSAFQRWRQAERDRQSFEEERIQDAAESEAQTDYDRRRETSSTTSSAPSAARDSTAATSVTSSQPASIKDRQPSGALATSASQASALDRSVTRTRRLYEQGLTQDLQDQQSSALSRMDTLSRQRPFGSRTPDLTPPAPSPTGAGFGDRVMERRPIVGKASAPNLRSFSPSMAGPAQMMSPPEMNSKFPRPEQKAAFVGNPPLSPPISETEDYPSLPIQPNDRGKATAMGVFQRPQQYDESKYAQRQRQLQQGRETPIGQASSEPNPGSEDRTHPTFFDDSDDASTDNRSSLPSITPQLTIERPDDQDHPAFRKSALPTPLSLCSSKMSDEFASFAGKPGELSPDPRLDLSHDSPTLGPTSGLSGMVRHHLRHDSAASSISGITDQDVGLRSSNSPMVSGNSEANSISARANMPHHAILPLGEMKPRDQDEFARHLADGARRVRERLTTYVESDSERSSTTTPLPEPTREFNALRANGLGILRSKSSKSSLADRDVQEQGRVKPSKVPDPMVSRDGDEELSGSKGSPSSGKDENSQAGLKAFRQARRDMQKMKELETQQRHQAGGPPLALFNRRPRDDSRHSSRSSAGSRAASEPRDRSGSETSTGGPGYSRGARLRNGSATYEEQLGQPGPGGFSRPSPKMGAAGFSGTDATRSPPRSMTAAFPTGMSPSHSTGAIDASGRRVGRTRDMLDKSGSPIPQRPSTQHEAQPYGRSRNGSLLGAAASTPNLHAAAAAAPPLPPINPRRKNGHGAFARPYEQGSHLGGFHVPRGGADDVYGSTTTSDDEGLTGNYPQGVRRVAMETDGRGRRSPPRGLRVPAPQVKMSRGGLPGGMI
ncbi:Ankyrin repeat-containing domain protein [Hirsutella rhossiliensis]|uniref:Ankyrin repeat-containing domain protein n=1 Tax=Hirsutella rhossiliensis TaxID=111463 RepID=A0A9P8SHI0_9HYPO|nr:Ankyrin repeat-containing domain protein [Hirsutella rhossiliensis]KAH0961550.1 Ankyrin repeat-containing domain protein [Hirsutella rhossiliensis]